MKRRASPPPKPTAPIMKVDEALVAARQNLGDVERELADARGALDEATEWLLVLIRIAHANVGAVAVPDGWGAYPTTNRIKAQAMVDDMRKRGGL